MNKALEVAIANFPVIRVDFNYSKSSELIGGVRHSSGPEITNKKEAVVTIIQTFLDAIEIESIARAICAADNCDPEAFGYGSGRIMPAGSRYPLWKARVGRAEAVIVLLKSICEV